MCGDIRDPTFYVVLLEFPSDVIPQNDIKSERSGDNYLMPMSLEIPLEFPLLESERYLSTEKSVPILTPHCHTTYYEEYTHP